MDENDIDVSRCLRGDEQAWETLVDRLWPVVAGTVWKCIGGTPDTHTVDDVCQEVFVRLCAGDYRGLRRFDASRGTLERYVAVMSRSAAIDAMRNRSRTRHVALGQCVEERLAAPEMEDAPIEDWELSAAIGTLTAREREVMDCLFRRELSTAETAGELSMAEATVRIHKMSGLEKLRRYFGVGG